MREDVGDGSGGVCDAGLRHCTLHAARCTQDACSHHMEDLMPGHCPIELVLSLCAEHPTPLLPWRSARWGAANKCLANVARTV